MASCGELGDAEVVRDSAVISLCIQGSGLQSRALRNHRALRHLQRRHAPPTVFERAGYGHWRVPERLAMVCDQVNLGQVDTGSFGLQDRFGEHVT